MRNTTTDRLPIVALDFDRAGPAYALAERLRGSAEIFKVGSQLFTAEGPKVVEKIADLGFDIFLDLKFHDIPNTVAGAVAAAAELPRVKMLTLHTTGGLAMMRAARDAVDGKEKRPALLGVTILTSMDAQAMEGVGLAGTPGSRALSLAKLAKEAGLDGVVASAHEVAAIREACGPEFLIVVPGIRPASAAVNDQSRVATPGDAIRAGASYLVVGRPITGAPDPAKAAASIAAEISAAAENFTDAIRAKDGR
ncbi:MAG: orotidine-5'-phosphate decarboxylase [Candidatus Acidiferrales bacterium]